MRLPRVCVAVIGSDGNEMAEKAESLVRDNSLLEFRLDYLSKPGLALPPLKRFLESPSLARWRSPLAGEPPAAANSAAPSRPSWTC